MDRTPCQEHVALGRESEIGADNLANSHWYCLAGELFASADAPILGGQALSAL